MPSAGQINFVYDQTRMRWMTSLTSGRFQLPLNLTEGNTVDFVFRLSNNGVLFTPALTPVWIFGIKDADDPNGDFLIQVNSATAASGVFTFVVELASAANVACNGNLAELRGDPDHRQRERHRYRAFALSD